MLQREVVDVADVAARAGGRYRCALSVTVGTSFGTVTDTGTGLEAQELTRVFERSYRVPAPGAERSRAGSGIGLTIACGIALMHDGDLTASSPGTGRGASLTLRLPATAVPS